MPAKIKMRFSPSPTGLMHLGNTRTALFNALYAKGQEGIFMLRIEDTDKERSSEEFCIQLEKDLLWLELPWDEGPHKDAGNGPYFQSLRQSIYNAYYQILEEHELVYPCFCSEETLELQRKVQRSANLPPRYAGTCKNLSKTEIEQKIAQGEKPVLRFKVPVNTLIQFKDFVKGEQRFLSDDIGDFIIRRADGSAPFMYCNAIDDALMGVTHVMRGEDHLTNTPRQVLILNALKLPLPQYGHISLIMGHDGTPLSKRHGSRSVHELQQEGYLPLGILNYLARLGHSYEQTGFLSLKELAQHFKLERLSNSAAKFDADQLLYWQKAAVAQMDAQALWQWMGIEVHSLVPPEKKEAFIETIKGNIIFPKDAVYWASRIFDEKLEYEASHLESLQSASKSFFETALAALEEVGTDYSALCELLKNRLGVKGKALFQPLRLSLTNDLHGPELIKVLPLMGQELAEHRFKQALKTIR